MKFRTGLLFISAFQLAKSASVIVTVYPQVTSTDDALIATGTGTRTSTSTTRPVSLSIVSSYNTGTSNSDSQSSGSITSATGQTTAITDCHYHGTTQFCVDGNGDEGYVSGAPTNSESGAASYTGCHNHDATATYCLDSSGEEVQFILEETATNTTTSSSGKSCHFHAGVEHCVGGDEDEEETSCTKTDRDYNIPLRIGLLFVILATSFIGVFGPILVNKVFNISTEGIIFIILKQFGTGIIISTAFVHLITHAELQWGSDCLGELSYESTGTSITMAGLFIAFLVEYCGKRLLGWRNNSSLAKQTGTESTLDHSDSDKINEATKDTSETKVESENQFGHSHHGSLVCNDKLSVLIMEAGIVFHSILIGITLVVAGDSYFITLFIVILFHQMFEGLALGSRISCLTDANFFTKSVMAIIFSIITPIGMAIGTGVLSKFNGNDPSTIIALGTLDSFSAGVLIWTGVVEMWVNDWIFGSLSNSNAIRTTIGMISLMAGMILMSVLGKWA